MNLKANFTFFKLGRLGFAKNTGKRKKCVESALAVHYPNTPEGKWVKLFWRFYWQETKVGYLDV